MMCVCFQTQDFEFDGVPVRLFVPEGGPNSTAAIIFMHGGGWVLNSVGKSCDLQKIIGYLCYVEVENYISSYLMGYAYRAIFFRMFKLLTHFHLYSIETELNSSQQHPSNCDGNISNCNIRECPFQPTIRWRHMGHPTRVYNISPVFEWKVAENTQLIDWNMLFIIHRNISNYFITKWIERFSCHFNTNFLKPETCWMLVFSSDKYNEMCGWLSLNTGMTVLSIGWAENGNFWNWPLWSDVALWRK